VGGTVFSGNRKRIVGAVTGCVVVASTIVAISSSAAEDSTTVVIQTLGTRADLVTDGDALTQVTLPAARSDQPIRVTVSTPAGNTTDETARFVRTDDRRYLGVINGLALGVNDVVAQLPDGSGARLAITNHNTSGPLFSGPQIQPWTCVVASTDPGCNVPTSYSYFYISTDSSKSGFQAYDPSNPATDVANTTTDQGVTVPFIVRQENGSADRGMYQVAVLDDPTKPFTATAPQAGWNHKMVTMGGAGCGTKHGASASISAMDQNSLAKGFLVASSGLLNNGQNCNLVVQAEALTMLRERVADAYGVIRYNIGEGCSGGAITLQQVTNAYPGLIQGLSLRCSFPDSFSSLTETYDCSLLLDYWTNATQRAVPWAEAQKGAVLGQESESPCQNWVDVYAFHRLYDPHNKPGLLGQQNCGVPAAAAFAEGTNPGGVRCALQDYMVNEFGRRASDGFANRPEDNVGVQYGMEALNQGVITADQFIDLNANVGSYDINYVWHPTRAVADPAALDVVYRSGSINEANNMAGVPIVDMRGHTTEDIHQDIYSLAMRARLDQAFSGHPNQVYWIGPGMDPATQNGDNSFPKGGPNLIDQWLTKMADDHRDVPDSVKVADDKPSNAVDACFDGVGQQIPDQSLCPTLFKQYENPREASGQGRALDIAKCQLKPLARTDYSVTFTDAQWAQLQTVFPDGVCDWTKPGVDQQGAVPWLSYQEGPGGVALGAAPTSVPLGS
jgi:hypothetical protein